MKLTSSVPGGPESPPPGAARRRRILDAATRLFAASPYDVVQMTDIARAAGVAKPTVYRHFVTKEMLYVEALEVTLAKLKASVGSIAQGPAPAAERLTAIVMLMFAEIGRLKALIRVAEGSGERPGVTGRSVLRRELRHVRAEIAAVIRDGVEAGGFVAVDPELAAMVVLGGVRMAADSGSADPAEAVATLLLGGLARRPPSSMDLQR